MEWQQILGFYHVAKLKSFTRAAEATFRTQSALTQQIKALEEELGCELLERIGRRKILLTPAGESVLRFSETILLERSRLGEEIAEHKGLKKGRLAIAAPFTTLYHLLPDSVRKFNSRYPWIELSLLDRPQQAVVELVRSGDVDLGLALESALPVELNSRKWLKVEPALLAKTGHPLSRSKSVSLKDISQYPLILPPKSAEHPNRNRLEDLFRQKNLRYSVVMESSNIELSSLYVEMGLGVTFASIVRGLPVFKKRKLSCISLGHVLKPEYLCVATRKGRDKSPLHRAFVEILFDATEKPLRGDGV